MTLKLGVDLRAAICAASGAGLEYEPCAELGLVKPGGARRAFAGVSRLGWGRIEWL
jgi:hypothetical protein